MIHTLPRGAGHLGRWAKGQWDKARPPGGDQFGHRTLPRRQELPGKGLRADADQ